MRRGKKGVSEVVAAMLLITITVSASILFYIYSSGLLGSLTGVQPQTGQYANQLTLEFYDWTNAGLCPPTCTTLKLTIRNVGSGLANIAAYYVSGTKITNTGSGCLSGASTISTLLPQGSNGVSSSCTVTLTIPNTLTITAGVAYLVKVVTKDGGLFSYSCIAGQKTGSV